MQNEKFLDELLNLPSVAHSLLSPDGRWVAFAWYHVHPNMDVFVVPTDGSAPPLALTNTPEYTWLVSWTADSAAVIVEEDHDGDEHVRLFRVDLDHPLEMQPLTEDRPAYFLRGGGLHPDGDRLFYGANYDFPREEVLEPTWIYRHDLQTGERIVLATPEKPVYMVPKLNLRGSHVLYARKDRHPSGVQAWLVDVDGRQDKEILNFGDRVKVSARWSPDSEHIVFLSESRDGRKQENLSLGVYHWPSERIRWLIDDPKRSLQDTWFSPEGTIIVDEIREAVHVPTYMELGDEREKPFPRIPGNLLPLGRAADGAWIATHHAANSPTELVRFYEGQETPELISLTRVWEHTELKKEQLTTAESLYWRSVDGLQIQGWLYRTQPNPRRAVIYIHGGPTYHSEDKLNVQIQYFVSRGFNVLDINYRGSTGFGLKYKDAIKEDGWGGREQADIASGIEALIREGVAEPGRVGVTGTSYGGYSSWFLLTHYPPEIVAAAAPICGMTDLVVDYETTRPDLRPYSEEMIGGTPSQIPEKYRQRSPINFLEAIRGQLLIVQGAQDPNVTPENVRLVREGLAVHKIPYDLLVFEDEGHGIAKQANQKALYERLAEFFDRALK